MQLDSCTFWAEKCSFARSGCREGGVMEGYFPYSPSTSTTVADISRWFQTVSNIFTFSHRLTACRQR